nr:JAB domain-containing protein [Xanthomonas melonis]
MSRSAASHRPRPKPTIIPNTNNPTSPPCRRDSNQGVSGKRGAVQALALLDIPVLDHLVIGGQKHTSLAARGWA